MSDSGFSEAVATSRKPVSKMASFSRSERNLSECESPGPSISRSESVVSLASSCKLPPSAVTPLEVRTLTNNFQKLLAQATDKIKELTEEKTVLEKKQGKLLKTNVEMAIQTKKLMLQQKELELEKNSLMAANAEFVEEVERLYKAEERWEAERLEAAREAAEAREGLEKELVELGREVVRERERWELEVKRLHERLESAQSVEKEGDRVEGGEDHSHCENTAILLQTTLEAVKEDLEAERRKREEAEEMVNRLSQELEVEEKELMEVKAVIEQMNQNTHNPGDKELSQLSERFNDLKAENFENIIENENLKKTLSAQMEKEEKMKKELEKVRMEKKRMEQNLKSTKDQEVDKKENHKEIHKYREEMEGLREELRAEREKVRNLASRQSQLVEVNRGLKEDNERLCRTTEHLEQLMGEEVTDINEILAVINNIQTSHSLLGQNVGIQTHERKFV